ncbi:MAG: hypothetical protein V4611_04300 [Patescibacteria group bacterium]
MNNDPVQPKRPQPTPSRPSRTTFTVPSREDMRREVPDRPKQVESQSSQAASSSPAEHHGLTVHPIDEAAVLREKALSDETVAKQPAAAQAEQQTPQGTPEGSLKNNHNTPSEKISLEEYSAPAEKEALYITGDAANKVSVVRRIIAGITIPIAWMLVVYGLNYAASRAIGAAMKADGAEATLEASDSWLWLLQAIPYIAAVIVALLATTIVKYGGFMYRFILALAITAVSAALLEALVHVPSISDYVMNPYGATSVFFNPGSEFLAKFVARAWGTVGLAVALGIISSFILCALIRLLRLKLPTTAAVILFLVIAALPVVASFGVLKFSESAVSRGDAAYTVVEKDGQTRIVGAWGLSEGKRLFISSFYEGYDAEAFECLKGAYSLNGVSRCFTYCADKIDGDCVEVHFVTGENTEKIQELMAKGECSPSAVQNALGDQVLANLMPNRKLSSDPPQACPTVKTPGGQEVRSTAWAAEYSFSASKKEYVFVKDGMVGYVQIGLPPELKGDALAEARITANEDALKFIDTFDTVDVWGN